MISHPFLILREWKAFAIEHFVAKSISCLCKKKFSSLRIVSRAAIICQSPTWEFQRSFLHFYRNTRARICVRVYVLPSYTYIKKCSGKFQTFHANNLERYLNFCKESRFLKNMQKSPTNICKKQIRNNMYIYNILCSTIFLQSQAFLCYISSLAFCSLCSFSKEDSAILISWQTRYRSQLHILNCRYS